MTLLSIAQDACDVIGLARPSSVISAADQNVRTLLSLANREGRELSRRFPWQALTTDYTFIAVATESQGALPVDFDRWVDETFWNRTRRRPVNGPLSAGEWQTLKATSIPAVVDVYRQVADELLILPVPTAGDEYAFTYISKNWARDIGGTGKATFTADDDAPVLNEEMFVLGIVWRFLQSRGLEYGEARQTYETFVAREMARDGGRMRIMAGAPREYRPRIVPPEGDWAL